MSIWPIVQLQIIMQLRQHIVVYNNFIKKQCYGNQTVKYVLMEPLKLKHNGH